MTKDSTLPYIQIVLAHPDGRTEKLVLDAETVLIGSGAHCDLRLPREHASIEHVVLTRLGDVIHARSLSLDPHPTVNGAEFVRTPVLPDAVVGVGPVRLWVSLVAAPDDDVVRRTPPRTNPLLGVAVVLTVPVCLLMSMAGRTEEQAQAPAGARPPLWGPPVQVCPQATPEAALAVALEKLNVAGAKRERRPFHVQDGVAAVPLFEAAAACFSAAGQPQAATEARAAAGDLRRQVEDDYGAHAVRLEHAVSVEDWPTARKEVAVLRGFTAGLQGPYVVWLSNEDRRLSLRFGGARGAS